MRKQIIAYNSQRTVGGVGDSVPLKKSLWFRLMATTVIVTLSLGIVVLCFVNYVFQRRIETEYVSKGTAVARTAACIINSEMIDKYVYTLEKDVEYSAILSHLHTMQREHKLMDVFVTRMTEDGQIFIFDTNEKKPLDLGDSLSWADAIGKGHDDFTKAFCRGECVEPLFSNGIFGRILSVYEPVYRKDGSVAAYAGVDISMDQIMRERTSAFVIFGIAAIFVFVAIITINSYVLRRHVIAPIDLLVKNTEAFLTGENLHGQKVAAADLGLLPKLRSNDELAVLEHSIIAMKLRVVAEIAERDQAEKARTKAIEGQLDTLKKIMNGMNLLICVTVPETGELLFASDHILSQFGVTGDVTGKLCYEVLGGRSEMCDYCPYFQLEKEPEKVVIWENSESNGKTYKKIGRLIDWPGGRKVHLEFGMDITDIKKTYETILYKDKIIGALNETAVLLLTQTEETFEDTMTNGIGIVVNTLNLDRVTVWRNIMKPDGLHGAQVFRWDINEGGTTPKTERFADFKMSEWMPRWEKLLPTGETINGPVRLLPEFALLQSFGCISIFISPIIIDGNLWGYVMFEDRTRERVFTDDEADVLRSTSLMISSALTRQEEAVQIREANERLTLLLDATPFGCILWNKDLKIVDCNETAVQLYGYSNKQELIEKYLNTWPEYQPDGRPSHETAFELLKKCFDEGHLVFERLHRLQDGTYLPVEITLTRIRLEDGNAIVAYTRDLREYKRMMSEIEQQTNLLHTVNSVSTIMLESRIESFQNDLLRSMEIMAGAVEADRAYIWKNYTKDGKLYCSQIYEWSELAEPQRDHTFAAETLYDDVVPGWQEKLSQGNSVSGIVREMSDYEKAILSPQAILSILVSPIFLRNQFWGFIGFDNCHNERVFSEKEETLLRSASQIIANALIRNEETEKASKAEKRIKLMLDATPLACNIIDSNLMTIDCNEASVKLYGFKDKQEYIERWNIEYCSPEYQPDGQRSTEKVSSFMKLAFDKGYCVFEWTHLLPDGTLIPTETTLVKVEYENSYVIAAYTQDLRVLKHLETEVEKIYIDPLTGIYNRRFLDETLRRVINSLSRSGSMLSFLMIDIDHFKKYNDTYGHDEGDKCLKMVAETLKKSLSRANDFVVRYGGEEFAVVLPSTHAEGACLVANRLLENIRKCNILHETSNVANHVTISIGVTTGMVKHTHSASDYIQRADEMLYKSKQAGRNQYNSGSL